jgi:hypothetical protein
MRMMDQMDQLGDADGAGRQYDAFVDAQQDRYFLSASSTPPLARLGTESCGSGRSRTAGMPASGRDKGLRASPPAYRRQGEFQELLDDCRSNPQHLSVNEKRLDALLNESDHEVTVAMLRQDTRLKAIDGYVFIANRRSALAQYKEQLTIKSDLHDPELQAAVDRLTAIGLHPDWPSVRDIVSETHAYLRESLRMREQYAELLALCGRSGKALSLIIQRKDMEKSLSTFGDLLGS